MLPPPLPPGTTPYVFDLNLGLTEFEAAIADEILEVAAAFDMNGRFVLRPRVGSRSQVEFLAGEFALVSGSVVSHNHPTGGPFSPDDAWFASERGVAELRAVTPSGLVYRLRRPPEGWPDPPSMADAVETIILSLREENRRRSTSGETIMQGRMLDRWLFERQREAFARVGVEMEKSSRWA